MCQPVPDPKNDFFLTGLRCDNVTSEAPGIFREVPPPPVRNDSVEREEPVTQQPIVQDRYPPSSPELFFNVIDQGDLDRDARPVDRSEVKTITVAPEVVHLSRFASRYLLYPNEKCPSRAAVCLHNANVAEQLSCDSLAHMWTMMASMLESCMDELPDEAAEPRNVMQFVILPTVKNLMLERSEDGDVQTAVYLCEVLQVITKDQTVRVPGLDISLIREWYLSYIDLLRDMCLFSHASFLIRSCNDQFIGSLNQQSTTVHESCPRCGKPIQSGEGNVEGGTARRACRSCRGRVGLCFLCHEPVKGVYVWCPGCGKSRLVVYFHSRRLQMSHAFLFSALISLQDTEDILNMRCSGLGVSEGNPFVKYARLVVGTSAMHSSSSFRSPGQNLRKRSV